MQMLLERKYYLLLTAALLLPAISLYNTDSRAAETVKSFSMVIQDGHTSAINSVSFSPNGRFIASASSDNLIKLWDINGRLLRNIPGHRDNVNSVKFTPDSRLLVSGSSDKTVRIWGLDGSNHKTISAHEGAVNSIDINSSMELIASGSSDGSVRLWDFNGKLVRSFNEKFRIYSDIKCVKFSPDGQMLASGGHNYYGRRTHTIKLWKLDGTPVKNFTGESVSTNVNSIDFSPDGKHIVSGAGSIVFTRKDLSIKIWDLDGNMLKEINGHSGIVKSVSYSPDGRSIISGSRDGTIKIWDTEGKHLLTLAGHRVGVNSVVFNKTGKLILSSSSSFFGEGSTIKLWDRSGAVYSTMKGHSSSISGISINHGKRIIASALGYPEASVKLWGYDGRLIRSINGHTWDVTDVDIRPDGVEMVTCSRDRTVRRWSIEGNLLKTINHHGPCYGVSYSPDSRYFITASGDGTAKLYGRDGGLIRVFRGHLDNVYSAGFSPDSSKVITSSQDTTVRIWDINGNPLKTFIHDDSVPYSAFSPDSRYTASVMSHSEKIILRDMEGKIKRVFSGSTFAFNKKGDVISTGSADKSLNFWKVRDGSLIRKIHGIPGGIKLSPDGKLAFTGSWDHTTRIWNIETGKTVSLLSSGNEWLMFTPDGYFDSSRNGGALVAMVKGLNPFGIDQFALQYNRPDIILKRMGIHESSLIDHYHRQYTSRLKRMGFSEGDITSQMNVPESKIISKKKKGKNITLKILFSDDDFELKRYNIYVNDVPIHGAYGKKLEGKQQLVTEEFELSYGRNKIEAGCINEKGAESIRSLTYADYKGDAPGDLYYIGFGISTYRNKKLNLKYAHKDAIDLESILKKMEGKKFRRVHTRTYLDRDVTGENIKNASGLLKGAGIDDTLIVFIAGHGIYNRTGDAGYFYLTYDSDINNISKTAVSFKLVESILQGIKPRKKLFLMDTCESGEIDEDTRETYFRSASSRGIRARTARALAITAGKKQARKFLYQRERFIYNDLLRRSGAIVFSSSRGGELSYESDDIQNGFFTQEIINAFTGGKADYNRDGTVTTEELRQYVMKAVPVSTGGIQHPVVDRDNIYQKFGFPVVR